MNRTIVGVAAAVLVGIGCGGPPSDTSDLEAGARAPLWTFTKIPNAYQARYVTAPAAGVDALPFEVQASGARDTAITRMAFMITGTLPIGSLSSFEVVYYPGGLAKPGTVLGTSSGASWAPGALSSIVEVVLATPITVGQNFRGQFALKVDVGGTPPYFFDPQLQTVTIRAGGVEKYLVGSTCDLPLPGDTFYVR